MKLRILWLGCAAATLAVADDAARDHSPQASIRVDVQMVSISTEAALSLVPALSDEKTIGEASARLMKMIVNDEATLLGWPVLWLRSGFQADRKAEEKSRDATDLAPTEYTTHPSSETLEELRYSTEFDPPQVPGGFQPPINIRPTRPKWGAIVPTTFEVRNLGCHLEAEAEVNSDGSVISLTLSQSYVRLRNFDHFHGQTSPLGIGGEMVQPRFLKSSATNQIRVRNGKAALLSVFVVHKPEPRVEVSLIRAKTTLLNPSDSSPPKK